MISRGYSVLVHKEKYHDVFFMYGEALTYGHYGKEVAVPWT